jgi:hypothetical protein
MIYINHLIINHQPLITSHWQNPLNKTIITRIGWLSDSAIFKIAPAQLPMNAVRWPDPVFDFSIFISKALKVRRLVVIKGRDNHSAEKG